MQITQHFKFSEFVNSEVADKEGIRNVPDFIQYKNILELAQNMERIRGLFSGEGIKITSGYRSVALNKRVGGVAGSHHCEGYAADFILIGETTVAEAFEIIKSTIFNYDQLILYPSFIHISFAPSMRLQAWKA